MIDLRCVVCWFIVYWFWILLLFCWVLVGLYVTVSLCSLLLCELLTGVALIISFCLVMF